MKRVSLGENVYAAGYAYYHPFHHTKVKRRANLAKQSLKCIQRLLVIPEDQVVVLETLIKEWGCFHFVGQSIHLEFRRRSDFQFVETLCHEAVHAEQAFTNRISFLVLENEPNIKFDGKLYQIDDDTISIQDQPWEIEAYKRQRPLAERVVWQLRKEGIDVERSP